MLSEGIETELKKVSKESVFITPTYQAVLNKNLLEATEALNRGDVYHAFLIIKTIIIMLNPRDRDELMESHVKTIQVEVAKAMKTTGVDLYWTRNHRNRAVLKVLREHVYGLFEEVMSKLHEGGYLERLPVKPKYPSRDRLGLPP